jgi:hypothetical protein
VASGGSMLLRAANRLRLAAGCDRQCLGRQRWQRRRGPAASQVVPSRCVRELRRFLEV